MSKKGIGPILGKLVAVVAGGLISNKLQRDAATPKGAGIIRDIGITAVGASAGSMALTAKGVIDCSTYGLEQAFCDGAHGVLLLGGFIMYWIGTSRTKNQKTT